MTTTYFQPQIPRTSGAEEQPVRLPRQVLELLSLVDLTSTGRRMLDLLLAWHDSGTGTVHTSKRALGEALGTSRPAVDRGMRELSQAGIVWPVRRGLYQLHRLLTDGASVGQAAVRGPIRAVDPESFSVQRQARYQALLTGLPLAGSPFVPPIPSDEPAQIDRDVFELLSLVDLTTTGRRALDFLISRHSPEDGTVTITQRELTAGLGAAFAAVNRGVRELAETNLCWALRGSRGRYQLHPVLTGGAVPSPVMACPVIRAADPDSFCEQRRARYYAQIANLPHTA